MYEFSVEQAANKINDPRSKANFKEVLNSYFNGNYRSATVMLWTVLICDLIYKLQYLRDIHTDTKALAILKETEDFQEKNPNNPAWEINLVKEIHKRTSLLDATECDAIETIQKHRHLSAHPILKTTEILFHPSREMVLSDMRIGLESVLTKPPILTKKVFDELVSDLENVKDLFPADEQLRKYLYSKYLNNLNQEVETQIFRSLWRITFRSEDDKCEENRRINYRALRILYEKDRDVLANYLKDNSEYFSQISEKSPCRFTIFFLGDYPMLYEHLKDSAKEIIKAVASSNIDLFSISYCLSTSIENHINRVCEFINNKHNCKFGGSNNICESHINDLKQHAKAAGVELKLNKLYITMYANSINFDAADSLFSYIDKNLPKFSKSDLEMLLDGIKGNNQTYWRGRANQDHKKIVDRCAEVFGTDFDESKYDFLP